ncbi:hypothetical protein [Bacteroides sp.]
MKKIYILLLLFVWGGIVYAQESFGCWGSQNERAQSSMGESIIISSESMNSGFQQGDWDQITSLERVDERSVCCYYDKQTRRVVIETDEDLKVSFYTSKGVLLQKINQLQRGRNYLDLGLLNAEVILIQVETILPGKQKTYKVFME